MLECFGCRYNRVHTTASFNSKHDLHIYVSTLGVDVLRISINPVQYHVERNNACGAIATYASAALLHYIVYCPLAVDGRLHNYLVWHAMITPSLISFSRLSYPMTTMWLQHKATG